MKRIGDDVRRELGRFGPQAALGELIAQWPHAVGEEIARNAWPARIARDGTLHVNTSSSTWAFELAQLEGDIRARLGELAPTKLRFAVGPLPEPELSPGQATRHVLVTTSRDAERGNAIAAGVADDNLRKLVARAAAASLAKARSGRSF
jgi:predicted nucleic acid-binding Zn ribbon protein